MTRKQLIAEITSDLRQYDEENLIDYRSLNKWIKNELKRFGNNIMVLTESFLHVQNGKAKLPEAFWNLHVAAKCDQTGYEVCEGEREHVIMSHYWKMRLEQTQEWDGYNETYIQKDFREYKEKVYFDSGAVNIYYSKPTLLKLTKGIKRDVLHPSCMNLSANLTSHSPHEINIQGEYIQTNFNEGYIYLQYLALPTAEDGDLYIPETQHNRLQEYLEYFCKMKIFENLVGNEDDPGKGQLLSYYAAKARETFSLAMTETKFEGLGKDWDKRLKNKMRLGTLKYERLFR